MPWLRTTLLFAASALLAAACGSSSSSNADASTSSCGPEPGSCIYTSALGCDCGLTLAACDGTCPSIPGCTVEYCSMGPAPYTCHHNLPASCGGPCQRKPILACDPDAGAWWQDASPPDAAGDAPHD